MLAISYRIVHKLTLPCLYFGPQIDIENAVEAVEQLKLTNSQEKEQLEWQEIIFDLIRTIKVRYLILHIWIRTGFISH